MNEFKAEPTEELSFFLGAWLGDGWADDSDGGKRLLLKVRSRDFAEEFARSATKLLHKTKPYVAREVRDSNGVWYVVKATSLLLYEFAVQPFATLQPFLRPHPIGFLRSFFTAEGNPSVAVGKKMVMPSLSVTICVSNTTTEYIEFARNLLIDMGYHPTRITVGYKAGASHSIRGVSYATKETEWQFRIARLEEVRRYLAEIGFADSAKQDKALSAFQYIHRYGSRKAAELWTASFKKQGRKWTRIQGTNPLNVSL
jgi:intein-encoded DNA endonuclease-like protein